MAGVGGRGGRGVGGGREGSEEVSRRKWSSKRNLKDKEALGTVRSGETKVFWAKETTPVCERAQCI